MCLQSARLNTCNAGGAIAYENSYSHKLSQAQASFLLNVFVKNSPFGSCGGLVCQLLWSLRNGRGFLTFYPPHCGKEVK
jgi:hypothetical protein